MFEVEPLFKPIQTITTIESVEICLPWSVVFLSQTTKTSGL